MGYAGTGDSEYRRAFAPTLDPQIVVYWTGPEVVSLGINREALEFAVARFRGHELLLWDNYPGQRLRPRDAVPRAAARARPAARRRECRGSSRTAMVQAVPSKLALATVAEWAREPAGYDPFAAFERALREHGAEVVEALRRLAPSPRDVEPPPDVEALVGRARARRRRGDGRRAARAVRVTDVARLRRDGGGRRGRRRRRARRAHDVALVEPGAHIGGMVSGGLCWTDVGDVRVLGGFARRFYAAVADHYDAALWE